MVQQSMTESSGVSAGMPLGAWFGRASGVVSEAVLPAESMDPGRGMPASGGMDSAWIGRLGVVLPRLALAVAVALLATAIALFAFRAAYADRVYPAVAVGDVNVGGMTVDQAVAAVEARAAALERGTVTFTYQGQTWHPTLSELGATVDVETSVDAAYALGRDDNAVSRLSFAGDLLRANQVVPLRTTVDRDVLASWFASVNADIDQRAVDASLVVDGAEVTISPEHNGIVVDEAAATELILDALGTLDPIATKLPVRTELPSIYAHELDGARADLATRLGTPIVVTFEDQRWEIAPADLTGFLTVATAPGSDGPEVALAFDHHQLAGWLRESFSDRVNRAPVDARIAWSAKVGGLVSLDPSADGAALRSSAFADAVAASFLGDRAPVVAPVVVTKPTIDSNNLGALGIDGLLARGDSNFVGGSEPRDNNIYVGVDLLNGELVAPGEEFSFNRAVGEITYDKGFVDAGVIENGIIGRDVGGGICQVSTTVFRAAILSGMPITEWHAHSLRLKGYERDGWTAGFDAAILQSGSDPQYWGDLRFRNETEGYMLVQAWTDYPYVIVEIYGNDDGRTVDLSEPQFSSAGGGFSAWFTRVITYADGRTVERTFTSNYK